MKTGTHILRMFLQVFPATVAVIGASAGCGSERLKLAELESPSVGIFVQSKRMLGGDATRHRYVKVGLTFANVGCEVTHRTEVQINGRELSLVTYGSGIPHPGYIRCSGAIFEFDHEPYDIVDVNAFEEQGVVDLVEITDGATTWTMEVIGLMSPRTVKGLDGSEDPIVLKAGTEATLLWSRPSDHLSETRYSFRWETREEGTGLLIDSLSWRGDEIRVQGTGFVFSVPDVTPGTGRITIDDDGPRLHLEVQSCGGLAGCDAFFNFWNWWFPLEIR